MRCLDGIIHSMDMSSEQALGDSDGQGNVTCCSPWDRKESDRSEQLNNSSNHHLDVYFVTNIVYIA